MAATSHTNLPSSTHGGFGSRGDPKNYGTYDSGIGSLTLHPYQYATNEYGAHDTHQQSIHSYEHPLEQTKQNRKMNPHPSNNPPSDIHSLGTNDRSRTMNMDQIHGPTKPSRLPEKKKNDIKTHQQKPNAKTTLNNSLRQDDKHKHPTDARNNNRMPKQSKHNPPDRDPIAARASLPLIQQHSPSEDPNNHPSEKALKPVRPPQDMKPTKSSVMRTAANKKKEEFQAQKRKNQYFPSKLKSQQATPETDAEQTDLEKSKIEPKQEQPKSRKSAHSEGEPVSRGKAHRNKDHPHSHERHRRSRRDDHRTDDNHSSADEDHHDHQRSKLQKRATFSDTHLDKRLPLPPLPPLGHSRLGHHHDPYLDYPLPPGHPLRRRPPYDDYPYYPSHYSRYDHRHLYKEADDIPPYLAPYHDPYDPFFDYEKRKTQPKHAKERGDHHNDHEDGLGHDGDRDDGARSQASRKSKHRNPNNPGRKSRHDHEESRRPPHWPPGYYPPQYYHEEDPLELWRQERNDYLKKKFKPTIHDVLYSQQWMKSDSYLENQRRRTLRDAQGYYFPYKKYNLKDYKDMQKLNNPNPYAEIPETTIDRKERAKKRQEYGTQIERQVIDHPHTRHIPPREPQPRKPWHLSNGESQDPNGASKRERALEYAKTQVKYRPLDSQEPHSERTDPNDSYVNNFFLDAADADDGDRSNNQGTGTNHQSYNNYDY